MQIEEITKNIEIVNGDKLYLLDIEKLDNIEKYQVVNGVRIGGTDTFELFLQMKEFVKNNDNFSLALFQCKIGSSHWIWLAYILYRINSMWQRVEIENSNCEYCTWKGQIANPTIPSLYDAVKDWKSVLDIAWCLPEVKCPGCGKKLNRKAIWAK